jgi:Cdc6-like AAA superfamily ATPase
LLLLPIFASIDLGISHIGDRSFTVNGAITPAKASFFYFLPPDLSTLEQHVVTSTFFMLYGTRGAGKTTVALQLLQHVASKYDVRPLKLDFNSISIGTTRAAFWRSVYVRLRAEAMRQNVILTPFDDVAGFVDAFTHHSLGGATILLMLDEFDRLDHAEDGIKDEVCTVLYYSEGLRRLCALPAPARVQGHLFVAFINSCSSWALCVQSNRT